MTQVPGLMDMVDPQKQFEALVEAYSPDLFRFAYWLCRDRTVAEDLVQETFMRGWKSLASLRDADAAKSWLITILRRENARRFERKQLESVSLEDIDLERTAGVDAGFGKIDSLVLRQALGELPADYREPLLMQVLGGFSAEEIAGMTESTAGAVTTRLFRARQKLRKRLTGEDERSRVTR